MLKRDRKDVAYIAYREKKTDNQRVGNNETCTVYTHKEREERGLG